MELATFIKGLITEGKVSVKGVLISFPEEDLFETKKILREYYEEDILEMPGTAPSFSEEAAIWAAEYFYRVVQLTIIRDAGEEKIKEQLKPFAGEINAAAMYSADLIFRHLPSLIDLVKGFAPADVLL